MLVLSRRVNEKILITVPPSAVPQIIELMLVEVRGDKARIGIQADGAVKINRQEIAEAIAAERREKDSEANPGIGEDFA